MGRSRRCDACESQQHSNADGSLTREVCKSGVFLMSNAVGGWKIIWVPTVCQVWALGAQRPMKPVLPSRRHRQVFVHVPCVPVLAPGGDCPAPQVPAHPLRPCYYCLSRFLTVSCWLCTSLLVIILSLDSSGNSVSILIPSLFKLELSKSTFNYVYPKFCCPKVIF